MRLSITQSHRSWRLYVDNTDKLEAEYRDKFEELKESMHVQLQNFLAESILSRSFESPELKAQVNVYKPIVETMVSALKASGVLNASKPNGEVDPTIVKVITEQTDVINNQSRKIKELKMRVKLHEMISTNLAGLNKDIIREAVTKFQGDDGLSEEELLKELTKFINTRKPNQKTVQFESIDSDIDEVDSILEGSTSLGKAGKFKPKTNITIPGVKPRVVTESTSLVMPEDNDDLYSDPAKEFLRDFGHIGG